MFYRYCLKPMAPWDIHYGGQPGSPCGAVKRGPAQFQVALPIVTQVCNSRKVVWSSACTGIPPGASSLASCKCKPGGAHGGFRRPESDKKIVSVTEKKYIILLVLVILSK